MSNMYGKYLAVFFAACFLALQFHALGNTQLEQSTKQIFHIEDVSSSVIDKSIDNKFIYLDVLQSKQVGLPQQKNKLAKQRQYPAALERQTKHAFRQYMQECLAAICMDHQDKVFITFRYRQKLALSFDLNPIFISYFNQVHSDESDSHASLS